MICWQKSRIDIDNDNVILTVADSLATSTGTPNFVRDRKNTTGHMTTGSTDAATFTFTADMQSTEDFSRIILLGFNYKAYTIKYWNGAAYTDFSTAIAETTNTATDKLHSFTQVSSSRIQITVTGTMTANDEKRLGQLILTDELVNFSTTEQFEIDIEHDRDRKDTTTISGKHHVTRKPGGIVAKVKRDNVKNSTILTGVRNMYESYYGFLVSFSGFDESLFTNTGVQFGYRKQDIFLMKCKDEAASSYDDGFFSRGLNHGITLVEVI